MTMVWESGEARRGGFVYSTSDQNEAVMLVND